MQGAGRRFWKKVFWISVGQGTARQRTSFPEKPQALVKEQAGSVRGGRIQLAKREQTWTALAGLYFQCSLDSGCFELISDPKWAWTVERKLCRDMQRKKSFLSGSKYVGEIVAGKRHGTGVKTWPNGDRCVFRVRVPVVFHLLGHFEGR